MSTRISWSSLKEAEEDIKRILTNSQFSSINHTPIWIKALEGVSEKKAQIALFYHEQAKSPFGFAPIFFKKMGPLEVGFSPLFYESAYGGVVASTPEEIDEGLRALISCGKHIVMVQQIQHDLKDTHAVIEPKETIVTPLNAESLDHHYSRVKKNQRTALRKAAKSGVSVVEGITKDNLRHHYDLIRETYQSKGFDALPKKFYDGIIHDFSLQHRSTCFVAMCQGVPIAAATVIGYGDTMYYWTGGSSRKKEHLQLAPNNVLQWSAIAWGYKHGYITYDMLGASIPGIKDFKLSWGGKIVTYRRIYSTKLLYNASRLYAKVQDVAGPVVRKLTR